MSDSATPWTVAHHAPLSVGFSRQEYRSGLPFPSPENLPLPGIEPGSPALQADTLPSELLVKLFNWRYTKESLISRINLFHFEAFPLKKLIYHIGQYGKSHLYRRRNVHCILWKLALSLGPMSLWLPGCPLPNVKSSWKQRILVVVAWESKHFWSWEWTHDILIITFYLAPGYCIISKRFLFFCTGIQMGEILLHGREMLYSSLQWNIPFPLYTFECGATYWTT